MILAIDNANHMTEDTHMNLTKNIISMAEALQLCPEYVHYVEGNFGSFDLVSANFEQARKGMDCITSHENEDGERVYVRAKVTQVNHNDIRAVDGPVVRVGNGEYTWRVDGCDYAWMLPGLGQAEAAVDACLAGAK